MPAPTTPAEGTIAPVNSRKAMTIEDVAFWSFVARCSVVVLSVLSAIAGFLALYFSLKSDALKDAALRSFQTESSLAIASADARAADANRKAAEASEGTAKALLATEEQRERAAKAEKDLLEVQQKLRPRTISVDQRTRLVAILSVSPKGPVHITCILGDGEGLAFAQQINDLLRSVGWTVEDGGVSQAAFTGNPVGLVILVHSASSAPPHAIVLQQAFAAVGIPLGGTEKTALAEGSVEIIVGAKP